MQSFLDWLREFPMRWTDLETPPQIPVDVLLRLQHASIARRPHDPAQYAGLGEILYRLAKYEEAAVAFRRAEALCPGDFRDFDRLARCYYQLNRPEAVLEVCDRGSEIVSNCSDVQFLRGAALRALGRHKEARTAMLRALELSPHAYEAAECLLLSMASESDGARLLALCDEFPSSYSNATVVRGYRAIALSRLGKRDEACNLVDLAKYPARVRFDPPSEFGDVESFNSLLADEILHNPGLRYAADYGFYRTEQLAVIGARAFPVLSKFLRGVIEDYVAGLVERGLDRVFPTPPSNGYFRSAANVVRSEERHRSHLHKYAYISGVYHVSVPPDVAQGNNHAGALVLGSCDDLTGGYLACWGSREIKPIAGVATLFPSHIFHSVVSTRTEQPRIAIPFDLCPSEMGH
jgi:tetratricopeptide (TPR) repeat protein